MENLLNNIENSEINNPLLTAALQEIDRLNNLIEDATDIITSRVLTMKDGDESPYVPTMDQANTWKIEMLSSLLQI